MSRVKRVVEPVGPEGVHEAANRKRDNIVHKSVPRRKGLTVEELAVVGAEARQRFEAYLTLHARKHTPERLFVLQKVYESVGPVDIQTLHRRICEEEGMVSLTTVYNNLGLLVDARLVRRLDLVGGKMAFYERTLGQQPHGYVICDGCGDIHVTDQPALDGYRLPRGFAASDVTFHIHGLCSKCQKLQKRKPQAAQKTDKETTKRKYNKTTK